MRNAGLVVCVVAACLPVWAMIASGCSATRVGRNVTTAATATTVREVGVGTELHLEAVFDDADTIFVRAIGTLQCRDARFAVTPANASRRAASTWEGDQHVCGRPTDPGAGVMIGMPIGVLVTFARSKQQLLLKGTTEGIELPDSNIMTIRPHSFAIARTIRGVSHFCGAATVGVYQMDHDTDEHVEQGGVPVTYDVGTPDDPATPQRRAAAATVAITGEREVELDAISNAQARRIAQECYDVSPAGQTQKACRSRETASARPDCELACSARVDATRCVSGARACRAVAQQDAADLAVCARGFGDCLAEEAVEPAKLDQCVTTCLQAQLASRCKS